MNWNFTKKAIEEFDRDDVNSFLLCVYYLCFFLAFAFLFIFGYLLELPDPAGLESTKGIQTFEILLTLGGVFSGLYMTKLFPKLLRGVQEGRRTIRYTLLSVLRIGIIAVGYLLGIVLFYNLGHCMSMLYCCAICMVAQIFVKPSLARIEQELDLDRFDNPNPTSL